MPCKRRFRMIFQFPPPRGGERWPMSNRLKPRHFNSRPREGANVFAQEVFAPPFISIPAPARGRTVWLGIYTLLDDFNSRPREGANLGITSSQAPLMEFQFPPPRGGEHGNGMPMISTCYFNSRPREGANVSRMFGGSCGLIFQFPPPRGGERLKHEANGDEETFQFPPPRGGELSRHASEQNFADFNSRPREGANRCSPGCR